MRHDIEPNIWKPGATTIYLIHKTEVLGTRDGVYSVRVVFDPCRNFSIPCVTESILFLEVDGDDFEIVGHEVPASPERKRAGQAAAAPN